MSRVTKGNNGITKKYNAITHRGVDIGWKTNEEDNQVTAHSSGVVSWVQTGQKHNTKATGNKSYGNCVKILHSNGYYTLYAHLKSVKVKKGQNVKQGEVIGVIGETGKAYGRHLHFEVRNKKDIRINPTKYIYCDLPNTIKSISYQVYDLNKKSWLPLVKSGTKEYAGNKKSPIGAVLMDELKYRVHDLGGKWLPYVYGSEDYAGNLKKIDAIQIYNCKYRVYVKNKGWLPWVSKVDDSSDGYAGIFGYEITCIQIKDIK